MPKPPPSPPHPSIEKAYENLDPIPGAKIELLDERIIISPLFLAAHNPTVGELVKALADVADRRGWALLQGRRVHIPPTRERPQPDIVVAPPDASKYNDHELYGHSLVLAIDVADPGRWFKDNDDMAATYARGEVPMYLAIDQYADTQSAILFSGLMDHRYSTRTWVPLGEPLDLPEPIDITLDTDAVRIIWT